MNAIIIFGLRHEQPLLTSYLKGKKKNPAKPTLQDFI